MALLELLDGLLGDWAEVAVVGHAEPALQLGNRRADRAGVQQDPLAGVRLEVARVLRVLPRTAHRACDDAWDHRCGRHGGAHGERRVPAAGNGLASVLREDAPAAGALQRAIPQLV